MQVYLFSHKDTRSHCRVIKRFTKPCSLPVWGYRMIKTANQCGHLIILWSNLIAICSDLNMGASGQKKITKNQREICALFLPLIWAGVKQNCGVLVFASFLYVYQDHLSLLFLLQTSSSPSYTMPLPFFLQNIRISARGRKPISISNY